MKTRLLIIIGIILASIGSGSFAYVVSVQSQCESLLGDTHYPRPLTLWNCLDYLAMIQENTEPEPTTVTEPEPEEDLTVCTMQWDPMCGIDGETYGNLCMLNASDVKLDYQGQCVIAEPEPEPAFDSKEHYAIEITGLKDVYLVGERYDFSYILSGYGHPCGGKTVTFPDSNGDTIGSASSASCIANLPMGIFVFDIQKDQDITYGHVGIKNPGTYTVTVTFDRPSQDFPTTASQEFRVVEE